MNGEAKVSLLLEIKQRIGGALAKAKQTVNSNVKEIKDRLNSLKSSHIEAFNSIKDSIPGLSSALGSLANPYVLATTAVLALGGAMVKASNIASDFDKRMAKANVTAQESKADLKATGNQLLNTAAFSKFEGAASASPQAYNILLSSGMNKNDALATVNPTLEAAKAGSTDVETVARAAANSMNSSGIKDANRLYDILFATLNKGNAEFADIANYLPKIIPVAKNVGLNMEQVSGSFAFLTAQGLKAEQAATGLENVFKVLGDPEKAKRFEKIGVSLFDQEGKMKPFKDTVEQLSIALSGLSDQQRTKVLDSLGLDMEAAGTLSILSQNAKGFGDTVDFVTNSTGQFQKAIESASTDMDGWVQIGNMIDVAWIKVGQAVNSVIGPIADWLLNIGQQLMPYLNAQAERFAPIWKGIKTILFGAWNIISAIGQNLWDFLQPLYQWLATSEMINDLFWLFGKALSWGGTVLGAIGKVLKKVGTIFKAVYDVYILPWVEAIEGVYKTVKAFFGFGKNDNPVVEVKNNPDNPKPTSPSSIMPPSPTGPNAKVSKVLAEGDKSKSGGTAIRGAEQVRNITTNIENVIGGDFISQNTQFSQMSPAEFEKFVINILTRFTRGMEVGLNS